MEYRNTNLRGEGAPRGSQYPSEEEIQEEKRLREKLDVAKGKSGAAGENKFLEPGNQEPLSKKKSVLYCHKCTKQGHLQKDCTAPPTCYLCKEEGHVASQCVQKKKIPELRICGGGAGDKMFYSLRIDVPESISVPVTVTGLLTVLEGECDGDKVINEMALLFETDWNWRLKPINAKEFLVEFPDAASRKHVTKFVNGFSFITDETVRAKVTESVRELEAFGVLDETWARIYGLPDWARIEDVVWALSYMVGEPREVDTSSLGGLNPVRAKIACKDKEKMDGFYSVYINGRGYRLEWEVETEGNSSSDKRSKDQNNKADGEEDQEEDSKRKDQKGDDKSNHNKENKKGNTDDESSCSPAPGFSKGKYQGGRQRQFGVLDGSVPVDQNGGVCNQFAIKIPVKMLTYRGEDAELKESQESSSQGGKVDIPDSFSDDEESPAKSSPEVPVDESKQWDGLANWTIVAHNAKKKNKQNLKIVDPVVAKRQSNRLQKNDDGLSIPVRAELRASKKNDISVDSPIAGKA